MNLLLRNSDKKKKAFERKKIEKAFIIIQANTVAHNIYSSQGTFVHKFYSNITDIIIIVIHAASKFIDI